MKLQTVLSLSLVVSLGFLTGAKPTHSLSAVKTAPKGLSAKIAASINPVGHRIAGKKGTVCEIWFVKSLAVNPKFKPMLNVKYPLTSGQLVGALRVAPGVKFTDFRGTVMKPGVYTLRYGKQPADGNHIGTSEVYDFLLALPAKRDVDPKRVSLKDVLYQRSAKASGTTHPAIFSLLAPAKSKPAKPTLSHDKEKEFWILTAEAQGKANGQKVSVFVRLICIGKSEE
ncbi:MAG: hypothetical protein IID45_07760 [Planctomycetes bacterium]|nr:hypothetical protein [Planctomycetota bacterium]